MLPFHRTPRLRALASLAPVAFVASLAACAGNSDDGKAGGTQFQGGAVVCADGAVQCKDLATAELCSDGDWRPQPCGDGVCEAGVCLPRICQPASAACNGNAVVLCSARGTSLSAPTPCPADQACAGGVCLPTACKAGSVLCAGHGVATCRPDGGGFDVVACDEGATCVGAGAGAGAAAPHCQAKICKPLAQQCNGDAVEQCDVLGVALSPVVDCKASGEVCVGGACVQPTCKPGATACMGSAVGACSHDGKGWSQTACPAGQLCHQGACASPLCVGGESFCQGDAPAVCDASGLGATVAAPCKEGSLCKQGACVVDVLACGDGVCAGDEATSCPADCGEVSFTPADFDVVKPGTPLGLPRAPRALQAKAAPPWTSSRAMALHAGKLLVVDVDNGALRVLDAATLAVEASVAIGKRPEAVVVSPDGLVFVSVRYEAKLARLPFGAWTAKPTMFAAGVEPVGMAMSVDGKVLYVALMGEDAVVALDPQTGKALARFSGVVRPRALLTRGDGSIVVVDGGSTVAVGGLASDVINAKLDAIAKGIAVEPVFAKLSPHGLRKANPVPVCRDKLTIKARLPNRAISMCEHPETGQVLVGHVLATPGSVDDVLDAVGLKPVDIPQPPKVVCSGGYGSTCKVVPPPPGEPPCVGAPVRPYEVAVSPMMISGKPEATAIALAPVVQGDPPIVDAESGRSILTRFDQPSDIVHHPTHTLALVAGRGSNNVLVLNTAAADPMRWPVAEIAVSNGPRALAIAPNGATAYVLCGDAFEVVAVDLQPLLATAPALSVPGDPMQLPTMEPMNLGIAAKAVYGSDPLSPSAQLGRKVFHFARNPRLSAGGRFACATCHLEGKEDKTVWFISEGPRQTPALAERLHDTAPFNWLGTKFKLTENIDNTTARMGGAGLLPAELAGLAAFLVEGLVAPPNPHVDPIGLTPQQLEGKAIFNDPKTKCATCHVPGSLTDGAQHDVGTATDVEIKVATAHGKPKPTYNTPSLRGLFYTAPYLHDGTAATLHQALEKTATTMGYTAHLTAAQRDALVAYLLTL